jgi:hypothetical protein
MLSADAPTPTDAEAMLDTVQRLRTWQAPSLSHAQTEQLTARLLAELDAIPDAPIPVRAGHFVWIGRWLPLALLNYQRRMIGWEVWVLSALIMAIGTFVTGIVARAQPGYALDSLPLVVIAPLVAAFGVGFVYRSEANPMVELEKISTLSLPTIVLARLTLIFGCNLLLSVGSSLALGAAWAGSDLSLGALVLAWLVPMTLLSAVAFLISVLTFEPFVGGAVALVLWASYHLVRAWQAAGLLSHVNLPALTTGLMPLVSIGVALLLAAIAFWYIGREERFDHTHGGLLS